MLDTSAKKVARRRYLMREQGIFPPEDNAARQFTEQNPSEAKVRQFLFLNRADLLFLDRLRSGRHNYPQMLGVSRGYFKKIRGIMENEKVFPKITRVRRK
jgi:hypothetical protein